MSDFWNSNGEHDSSALPETITCVDCGGVCHRLSLAMEGGDATGDVVSYRCEDCLDRWDLIAGDPADVDDLDGEGHEGHGH